MEAKMAKIHPALWFRFLLLTLLSSMAWAQQVPTDDTYVTGVNPTTANGSSTSLVVQGSTTVPQKPSHTFIRFDLSTLNGVSGTQIQKATLRLYVTAVSASGSFDLIELGASPTNWTEATLVYNTTGASAPSGTTRASGVAISSSSKSQFIYIDVTPSVVNWLNGTLNNGFALVPSNGYASPISVSFSSKEDTTYSQTPTLIVVVKPGFGSSSGVQSFNGRTGVVTSQSGDYTFGQISGGQNNNVLTIGGSLSTSGGGTIAATSVPGTGVSGNISGNAANVTGTIGISNGGTGLSLASVLAGSYLRGTGSGFAVGPIQTTDIPSGSGNYIQNGTAQQTSTNFNISGNGTLGGSLTVSGGKSSLAGSSNAFASLNIPNGSAVPGSPVTGDIWLLSGNNHLQFKSMSGLESLAFFSDITSANSTLLSGNNTWTGNNTFNNTITGSITGNAGTVTNGVYTSGSYANPSWITSL
jgi:hypothetical protein